MMKNGNISSFALNSKYVFDVIMAIIAIIIFSPVMLIIAIAIKIEDHKGSIIFKQVRVGYMGKDFILYKFRSMIENAESVNSPILYTKNDKRLTRVGKFIREHHLDEFPQLWNVVKGDMSFVGPRPERRFYVQKIIEKDPRYTLLYNIRPGLFSYATLYNGYTDTIEKMLDRLKYDLKYIEEYSFITDIKIIIYTTLSIIFGKKF